MTGDIRVRLPLPVVKLLVEIAEDLGDLQPGEAKAVADAHAAMDHAVALAKRTMIR